MLDTRSLEGQVALVTGGSRGLGREFARGLAQHGVRVAVTARSLDQLNETVALINAAGGEAISIAADVRDATEVNVMVRTVEARLGAIDILVNNAGKFGPIGPIWEVDSDDWEGTIATNVFGTRHCLAAVLPGMVRRRSGRVIIIASSTPLHTKPYLSAYASSKAFIIKLAEEIAPEVRQHGISIFSIHPGTIMTSMSSRLINSAEGKKYLPWFPKIFAEGRNSTPEDAMRLILQLLSGDADDFSGSFFDATRDFEKTVEFLRKSRRRGLNLRVRFPFGAKSAASRVP